MANQAAIVADTLSSSVEPPDTEVIAATCSGPTSLLTHAKARSNPEHSSGGGRNMSCSAQREYYTKAAGDSEIRSCTCYHTRACTCTHAHLPPPTRTYTPGFEDMAPE